MDIEFGDRLKLIRGAQPQKEFAKSLGVHTNTIGRWERNEQSPTHQDMCNILDKYPAISPAWLLVGDGPMYKDKERGEQSAGDIPQVDEESLEAVIAALELHLEAVDGHLPPAKKAKLIVILYELLVEDEEREGGAAERKMKKLDSGVINNLIKLAA